MHVEARLPEPVEVAAYYVVAEALTNVAKHAHAAVARVDVRQPRTACGCRSATTASVAPTRPGAPGWSASATGCEAMGGTLAVDSPTGQGTRLLVELPVEVDGD